MSTMVEMGAAIRARTRTLSSKQPAWEKWSNDGTEQQVAKLMEEDVGASIQGTMHLPMMHSQP